MLVPSTGTYLCLGATNDRLAAIAHEALSRLLQVRRDPGCKPTHPGSLCSFTNCLTIEIDLYLQCVSGRTLVDIRSTKRAHRIHPKRPIDQSLLLHLHPTLAHHDGEFDGVTLAMPQWEGTALQVRFAGGRLPLSLPLPRSSERQ